MHRIVGRVYKLNEYVAELMEKGHGISTRVRLEGNSRKAHAFCLFAEYGDDRFDVRRRKGLVLVTDVASDDNVCDLTIKMIP